MFSKRLSFRSSRAFSSARLLCFLLCIFLLLTPALSFSNELNGPLLSIEQKLRAIVTYSAKLEDELQLSQSHIERLSNELRELKNELKLLKESSESYRTRAEALLSTIDGLEKQLDQLSRKYNASEKLWRQSAERAQLEAKLWKIGAILLGIVAAGAGTYILVTSLSSS